MAEARYRKEAIRLEEQKKKEAALENEYWKDDDKGVQKKLQRKDDKEKKRLEVLARKAELKTLADEETKTIKVEPKQSNHKITRLQIQAEVEKREAVARGSSAKPVVPKTVETEEPIPENVNRLVVEGDVARTVDEAISVLRISDSAAEIEKHPEKRMKAAFTAYEEKNLPLLRKENPNMRLSQVKQLLYREWLKSPENPMNMKSTVFNAK